MTFIQSDLSTLISQRLCEDLEYSELLDAAAEGNISIGGGSRHFYGGGQAISMWVGHHIL